MVETCDLTVENLIIFFGAVIGLFVQYWFMRRSELRSRITDLIKEIDHLEDIASIYWSNVLSDGDCLIHETKIKSKLHNIQRVSVQLQRNYYLYRPDIKEQYLRLKKIISGGEFESRPKPRIIGRIELIERYASDLKNGVRDSQKIL